MFSPRLAIIAALVLMAQALWAQCPPDLAPEVEILTGLPEIQFHRVSDFDGDGDFDLVIAHAASRDLVWYERTGSDVASLERRLIASDLPLDGNLIVTDFDGDDDTDVLVAGAGSPEGSVIHLLENSGSALAPFGVHRVSDGSLRLIDVGNVNGDNLLDLIAMEEISPEEHIQHIVWIEQMNGASSEFTTHSIIMDEVRGRQLVVDLDQDDDTDIIYVGDGAIRMMENLGGEPLSWELGVLVSVSGYTNLWASADLDGDGDIDLAGLQSPGGRWIENPGSGGLGFTSQPIYDRTGISGGPTLWFTIGDFNSDGFPDIVKDTEVRFSYGMWTSTVFQRFWYLNDGSPEPAFTGAMVKDLFAGISFQTRPYREWNYDPVPIDWDDDGDTDMVSHTSSTVVLDENLYTEITICSTDVHDQNDDGVLDIGEPASVEVTIHNQTPGPIDNAVVSLSSETPDVVFTPSSEHVGMMVSKEVVTIVFPFTVPETLDCGVPMDVTVNLTWDQGSTAGQSMIWPGFRNKYTSDNSDAETVAIPDNDPQGIVRTVPVRGHGGLFDVLYAKVIIHHPHRGDLLVTVEGPAGDVITLFDGDPSDSADFLYKSISDWSWRGEPVDGMYTLRVIDRVEGNIGTLDEWILNVDYYAYSCMPWDDGLLGEYVVDALIGRRPPSNIYNLNDDNVLDAADVVTALQASP